MKIIQTKVDLSLEFQADSNMIIRVQLPAGNSYVMSDGVTKETSKLYGNNSLVILKDLKDAKNRFNNQDLTNKKLLSIREGGAGDLLFKTPVFRYLKQKYADCHIALACSPIYHSIFKSNPVIDTLYSNVIPLKEFEKYDYFITFEGIIENNKEAQTINAYDLFARCYGLDPALILDKTPVFNVSQINKEYWQSVLGDSLLYPKKVGYQWRASSPVRTLPYQLSADIIKSLIDKGYKVFLLDAMSRKNEVGAFLLRNNLGEVVDTSKYSDSFERMGGIISLVDIFAGPDSSGTHLAAALGKPIVGMYGPFRSALRLKYYKNAVGIDCTAYRCGNGCFIHSYDICDFAKEVGESSSPCWKLLDPQFVADVVDSLYTKIYATKEELI